MEKLVFISHEHNEKEINPIGKIRSLAHDMWKKKNILWPQTKNLFPFCFVFNLFS